MNFSLEISPKTDLETLPPVKDVYVTMLPGGDYKETSDQSIELVKKVLILFLISLQDQFKTILSLKIMFQDVKTVE